MQSSKDAFSFQREITQETSGTLEPKQDLNLAKKQISRPVKAASSGPRRVEQRLTTQTSVAGKKRAKKLTGKENLPEKLVEKKTKVTCIV